MDRARRPPSGHALGRPGMVMHGSGRDGPRADEESVREEQGHLRASVAALKREGAEVREKLRNAEKESARKDKQLHDMLAMAKCGNGVPGEVLDQVREDLQALLQYKRTAQEARTHLEEKELRVAFIQQELRQTKLFQMEQDVERVKMEAKAKATEWIEANSGDHDTHVYTMSMQHQQKAKELLCKIAISEKEFGKVLQRFATLQDEAARLEKASDEHRKQIEKLQSKRGEIEDQREQSEKLLQSLSDVPQLHATLKLDVEKRKESLEALRKEADEQERSIETRVEWNVNPALLIPGFRLLRRNHDPAHNLLLWRIRHAIEAKRMPALQLLRKGDADKDGRLTAHELYTALRPLNICGCTLSSVDALICAIGESIPDVAIGYLPIVDFVLALPLEPPPPGPSDAQLQPVLNALAWAGRRQQVCEQELRKQINIWLHDPSLDLVEEASRYCRDKFGLDAHLGRQLGLAVEVRRFQIVTILKPWRVRDAPTRAAVLCRFLTAVATHRDVLLPLLSEGGDRLSMAALLQAGAVLGAKWSIEDLELVALSAELPGVVGAGDAPVVDVARIRRSVERGGFALQFPDCANLCTKETAALLDSACAAAPRKLPAAWEPKGVKPPQQRPMPPPEFPENLAKATRETGPNATAPLDLLPPTPVPPTPEDAAVAAPAAEQARVSVLTPMGPQAAVPEPKDIAPSRPPPADDAPPSAQVDAVPVEPQAVARETPVESPQQGVAVEPAAASEHDNSASAHQNDMTGSGTSGLLEKPSPGRGAEDALEASGASYGEDHFDEDEFEEEDVDEEENSS